jgi:TetR/AcrR family transcriptional regulator, transcriptional repressor for nem operon
MISNIQRVRYDESHKEKTRLRVLSEAATAIRTKGAERVSVAEVMAAAGLTHGGFYAHFDSKDDMVAQAITHMFDHNYARFMNLTEGREPAAAVANYVDHYLGPLHRNDRASGCPVATLSGDLPNMSERARERFTDGTERWAAALAKLAKNLGAKDADAVAWSAIAEMAGAIALSRTVSDKRAAAILRNSRANVKARFGLPAR